MCICINCRHICSCTTYKFITRQHNDILTHSSAIFHPSHTIINVNVNKKNGQIFIDWDLIECLSFVEKPGNWFKSLP